jgi:hypothetical protein
LTLGWPGVGEAVYKLLLVSVEQTEAGLLTSSMVRFSSHYTFCDICFPEVAFINNP